MKETRFIAQNKEKWLESEALLKEERKDPGKLSDLFVQVVDDLSYSRTYYPNRSVRVYLNKIAREYFSIIYNRQRQRKGRLRLFWLDELPQVIIYCRVPLLISLITFLFAIGMGVFSSVQEPQFANTILGPGYVEMTKANIEQGDPMAVYKKGHQVDMFLGITLNNLMVAFRAYVFGLFFSIGTLAILLSNGIMVGCFQYFFIERSLFAESALTIWLHGTLEISAIIIAGGAGLTLGSGLLFPGTYSRLQAFQLSAMRSLKLMLGVAPILVVAGLIESFLTRYTEVPDAVRLLLILLSAAFIVGYFVIYPWRKSRAGFEEPLEEIRLTPADPRPVATHTIKNNAEILKDAFTFYRLHFNSLLAWVTPLAVLVAVVDVLTESRLLVTRYFEEWWVNLLGGLYFAMRTPDWVYVVLNTVAFSLIIYKTLQLIHRALHPGEAVRHVQAFLRVLLLVALGFLALWGMGGWGALLLTLGFGYVLLVTQVQMEENTGSLSGLARGWDLTAAQFGPLMGLQFTLLLMSFSFLLILSAPLIYLYTTVFQWNFARTDTWARYIVQFIEVFVKLFTFQMIVPLVVASMAYFYHSAREVTTARYLKESIAALADKYHKRPRT